MIYLTSKTPGGGGFSSVFGYRGGGLSVSSPGVAFSVLYKDKDW